MDLARKANDQPQNRLFLLAEALKKAGCDTAAMLDHCRQIGGHVKGCWVVDLLLDQK